MGSAHKSDVDVSRFKFLLTSVSKGKVCPLCMIAVQYLQENGVAYVEYAQSEKQRALACALRSFN
jgi:hypothetical protein